MNRITPPMALLAILMLVSTVGAQVNLALVGSPTASYVSGDTSLKALNDGVTPRTSRDTRTGSYGNWNRRGTQWVEYEWSKAISTNKVEVYWWNDNQGVRTPAGCRVLYWKDDAFVPVSTAKGLGIALDTFNVTTFDEVTTTRIRLEIDSDGTNSTGILEWRVIDSGKSPAFPPTVIAGVDRMVVLGGKTYLNGSMKALKEDASVASTWTRESGPGEVTFADPRAPVTTATFSAPGEYVLKLTGAVGSMTASSTLSVKAIPAPPAKQLDVVYTRPYTIDNPLWNHRSKALMVSWIPWCIDQINRTDLRQGPGGIDNFIEAAKALRGEAHEAHKGYVFSNAWVHQTVEAMCIALMVDPKGDQEIIQAHERFKTTLEDWIPKILAAQESDGYLQTAYTLANRQRWPLRWNPPQRQNHEGYVAGYFIESAINHYTLTDGKDLRLYNAAKKLADCWVANIGPAPKKEWYDEHQEMEQALVRFGRFVNDMEGGGKGDSYIALAKFLLDSRKNGREYDQSHLPVVQQYEAVGHAVRAVYSYSGMADVAVETHDHDYHSAVMSLWDNIVNKKYYVTGGIGSGETSEGFGPNYSLRNNAYCESCSTCGLIFFQYKLNLAHHDAKYADLYEESMYNALLGSYDMEGKNFYYQNPLDARGARYPWHACPCCVGNIPRTLLMLPTWMYARGEDGIYVNMFVGSTVKLQKVAGTDVELLQTTDYPWSGNVGITVNPEGPKAFSMRIRVPQRSVSEIYSSTPSGDGIASITVNGSPITPTIEKGYAVINRTWNKGDKIQLALPMPIQRIKAIDQVASTAGRVALRYGPLLYNIESTDQDIEKVLPADAPLRAEWDPNLLGGVMVIKGTFADGTPLLAIPNYARMNRGGRSIVWIRDR